MPDLPPLQPGDRFRLGHVRSRTFAFGLKLDELGTVTVPFSGAVELRIHERAFEVVPQAGTWSLALIGDGRPAATYAPARKRRGTITTTDGELVLDLDDGKEQRGTLARGETTAADVRERSGVVLVEPREPLDATTAAFAAAVMLLRGRFEQPPDRLEWKASEVGWWGGGLFGRRKKPQRDDDWNPSAAGPGDATTYDGSP